jgi:hypothetical protein
MFKKGPSRREVIRLDIEWIWEKEKELEGKLADLEWRLNLRDWSDEELLSRRTAGTTWFAPQSLVDAEIARRVRLKGGVDDA